ncbi:lopap-like [Panonychus citri]|uniref:lopap-like n=1 Tax=Panonychus citri TaxID=50023 RepID=UPI00230819AD|nr:lopap-like [Panonychus citri]
MYLYLFMLITVLISTGQSKKVNGPCPIKIKDIETIDTERYLGKWYDIYVDPNQRNCPKVLNCTLNLYRSYMEDKHVFNVNYYSLDGPYKVFCSFGLYQYDYDVDAKLFADAYNNPVYILDTDYDNYAVEVGCLASDDEKTHEERIVIRSRTKSMDDDLLGQLKRKIVDFGFAEPELIAQDYSSCPDYEPWI